MIDFEQAMRDQEDLDALCTRGFPGPRVELLGENDGYGHARILKEYSDYPPDRPIQAVIPHGLYLNASWIPDSERDSGLPAVLNYPRFRADVWERETDKKVIPSASPFLYALSMFRERFSPIPDVTGTIFFPAHTVRYSRTNTAWADVINELDALDERFKPISVCLHYHDYRNGLHVPFMKHGFRVLSAGSGYDPEFLYRWLHLASTHRYAASNDVGGAAIYAAKLGLPVRMLDTVASHFHMDSSTHFMEMATGRRSPQARETKRKLAALFMDGFERPSSGLAETVDYLLGAENMRSRQDLRAELEWVDSLASGTA